MSGAEGQVGSSPDELVPVPVSRRQSRLPGVGHRGDRPARAGVTPPRLDPPAAIGVGYRRRLSAAAIGSGYRQRLSAAAIEGWTTKSAWAPVGRW